MHGHVGLHEIAERMNLSRERVRQLRTIYPDFPAPVELACGPVWHTDDVERWLSEHYDEDARKMRRRVYGSGVSDPKRGPLKRK